MYIRRGTDCSCPQTSAVKTPTLAESLNHCFLCDSCYGCSLVAFCYRNGASTVENHMLETFHLRFVLRSCNEPRCFLNIYNNNNIIINFISMALFKNKVYRQSIVWCLLHSMQEGKAPSVYKQDSYESYFNTSSIPIWELISFYKNLQSDMLSSCLLKHFIQKRHIFFSSQFEAALFTIKSLK